MHLFHESLFGFGKKKSILWPLFGFIRPILISFETVYAQCAHIIIWFGVLFCLFSAVPETITNAFMRSYAKIIQNRMRAVFRLFFLFLAFHSFGESTKKKTQGTPFKLNAYIRLSHLISSAVSAFALNLMRFEHRSPFEHRFLLGFEDSFGERCSRERRDEIERNGKVSILVQPNEIWCKSKC